MSHYIITLDNIGLVLPHKTCFTKFSANIRSGQRVGIIGQNGNGKTTLLEMIQGLITPTEGNIATLKGAIFAYLPQMLEVSASSRAERLIEAFAAAILKDPDVLCLDEPTNHLDRENKDVLLRRLSNFAGTLIIVTHDTEVLNNLVNEIWHIEEEKVTIFKGKYLEYTKHRSDFLARRLNKLSTLKKASIEATKSIAQENQRAARSKRVAAREPEEMKMIERLRVI